MLLFYFRLYLLTHAPSHLYHIFNQSCNKSDKNSLHIHVLKTIHLQIKIKNVRKWLLKVKFSTTSVVVEYSFKSPCIIQKLFFFVFFFLHEKNQHISVWFQHALGCIINDIVYSRTQPLWSIQMKLPVLVNSGYRVSARGQNC